MASKLTVKDFKEDVHVDWCPGCGDFGALNAIQMALADTGWKPHEVAVFSGIGCSGKTSQYIRSYGIHTLHGRVLAYATGAKLADPDLKVIAVGGDGDGYGIGACHFLNAGRRNLDVAYIVYNNNVYGLTKGQASPTLGLAEQTKSLPQPNINAGVNPLATALAAGYTWIGRGYTFDVKGLKELILSAIEHKGAALLDIMQPCPTYNNLRDRAYFTPRVKQLADSGYDGVVPDGADEDTVEEKKLAAMHQMMMKREEIPLGVYYQHRMETYEERIAGRMPAYPKQHPSLEDWRDGAGKPTADLGPMWDKLKVA